MIKKAKKVEVSDDPVTNMINKKYGEIVQSGTSVLERMSETSGGSGLIFLAIITFFLFINFSFIYS